MDIEISVETWPLANPFRITGRTYTEIELVVATVRDGEYEGRGEAAGVDYLGETPASIAAAIHSARGAFAAHMNRAKLQSLLPAGDARNALDCALWDLEAARSGRPVWKAANVASPQPCLTTWTIGADVPEIVAERALAFADARAIKLKLTGDGLDAARVSAVRSVRPEIWLGVDGNQGFSRSTLEELIPALVAANVALIEQPLPMDRDADLHGLLSPIPLAADESVQGFGSIDRLADAVSMINIKLDKCGGLTEGLAMVEAARARGLGVMVGNMLGTSLAMAPAFVIGQFCDIVDLDGPVLLQRDRVPAAVYRDGAIWCGDETWGRGVRTGAAAATK